MKPDERAQHRWPPVPGAATPPLPRIRSISRPAIPFMPSHRSARTPDCRSEKERSAYPVVLAVSRETGSQPPGRAHHICPFSPAVHVVTLGFAVLPQCTALDQHLPKQPYLPHSSISAQCLPSLRTRRTRRPTSSIHAAAASGSSSRATAHDGSTSGKESPSVINAIRQREVTDSVLSSVCRVLWNTPGGGLAIGFT